MAPNKKQLTLLEALMHGAGGGPDGEVLAAPAPAPKFVPNTTPEVDFPADDLGIQVANMPPETIVGNPNLTPAQLAAGGSKKSSTMRAEKSKPSAAKAAENPQAQPSAAAAAEPVQDAIAQLLAGNMKKAEGDRDSAKARALASKDLSDGEKIFTALMAVMPGLVGAVGGGAIAGGAGAAAGAAGGLQGGANAVGMMMGEKEQLRQEALGEAGAAQKRADEVAGQQLGHAEKLQGQQFQVGERKAAETFRNTEREDEQSFRSGESAKDRANQRGNIILQGKIQERLKMLDNEGDIAKAQAAARAGNMKVDDTDVAFYNNTGAAMRAIKGINQLMKAGAGGAASWTDIVANPEARSLLKQNMAELAHAYTKIGDPNSAVLLAELENTTEALLGNPDTTRASLLASRVNAIQQKIIGRAGDYSTIRPQIPLNPEIQALQQGGTQPAANGAQPQSNQQRFGF